MASFAGVLRWHLSIWVGIACHLAIPAGLQSSSLEGYRKDSPVVIDNTESNGLLGSFSAWFQAWIFQQNLHWLLWATTYGGTCVRGIQTCWFCLIGQQFLIPLVLLYIWSIGEQYSGGAHCFTVVFLFPKWIVTVSGSKGVRPWDLGFFTESCYTSLI